MTTDLQSFVEARQSFVLVCLDVFLRRRTGNIAALKSTNMWTSEHTGVDEHGVHRVIKTLHAHLTKNKHVETTAKYTSAEDQLCSLACPVRAVMAYGSPGGTLDQLGLDLPDDKRMFPAIQHISNTKEVV